MVVSNKSMLVVARESLKIAKREYEELGNLFIEDQFRHIVVSELKKKRKRKQNERRGAARTRTAPGRPRRRPRRRRATRPRSAAARRWRRPPSHSWAPGRRTDRRDRSDRSLTFLASPHAAHAPNSWLIRFQLQRSIS